MPHKDPEARREYQRQYRERNREKLIEADRERYRRDPESYKQRSRQNYRNNREARIEASRERYRRNRSAYLAQQRTYYQRNREAIRQRDRVHNAHPSISARNVARAIRWNRANPDKRLDIQRRREAAKRGAGEIALTREQWERIVDAFDHRCAYCGTRPRKLTQDHVVPLSKGGSHTPDNVVPACHRCNCRKCDRPAPPFVVTPKEIEL